MRPVEAGAAADNGSIDHCEHGRYLRRKASRHFGVRAWSAARPPGVGETARSAADSGVQQHAVADWRYQQERRPAAADDHSTPSQNLRLWSPRADTTLLTERRFSIYGVAARQVLPELWAEG